MALVKFFVNEYERNLIEADVLLEGERGVDIAKFKIRPDQTVNNSDEIYYIQDIVDTLYLRGMWNFQGSTRDESGYQQDGNDGTFTADFIDNPSAVYTRNAPRVIRFNASGERVTVTHKNFPGTSNPIMDFSGQFDIHMSYSPEAFPTDQAIVFSKTTGGIGGGIEIGVSSGDPAYVYVEFFDQSGILTTITGSNVNLRDTEYHMVRVKRDENNLVTVDVDGVNEYSDTIEGDFTNTEDIIFGDNYNSGSSNHYEGKIAMIRVYCGGYLNDTDAYDLLYSKRIPYVMKFGGLVWNVEGTDIKVIECKSFGKLLNEIKITKDVLDARDESGTNNGTDNIFLDDSGGVRMSVLLIITQIMENTLSDWIIDNRTGVTTNIDRYVATGAISDIIGKFLTTSNDTFFTTPRKVLTLEGVADNDTDYIFINGQGTSVINDGSSDTTTVNDLEVLGTSVLNHYEELFDGDASTVDFQLSRGSPQIVIVEHPLGTVKSPDGGYTIDYENSIVTFTSPPASGTGNILIKYESEVTSDLYFRSEDTTSITNIGRYSARIYFTGMKDLSFLATFASQFVAKHKDILPRITIDAPSHINYVRYNENVEASNDLKEIDYTSGGDGRLTVKSIHYKYPNFSTSIDIGAYKYDEFDVEKRIVERISGLDTTASKSLQS